MDLACIYHCMLKWKWLEPLKYQQTQPIYLALSVQSNVKLKGTYQTFIIRSVCERCFCLVFSRAIKCVWDYLAMWVKWNSTLEQQWKVLFIKRCDFCMEWIVQWVEHLGEYGKESTQALIRLGHCVMWCSGRKLTTLCFRFYNIRIVFEFCCFIPFAFSCCCRKMPLHFSLCLNLLFIVFHFSAFLAFTMQNCWLQVC